MAFWDKRMDTENEDEDESDNKPSDAEIIQTLQTRVDVLERQLEATKVIEQSLRERLEQAKDISDEQERTELHITDALRREIEDLKNTNARLLQQNEDIRGIMEREDTTKDMKIASLERELADANALITKAKAAFGTAKQRMELAEANLAIEKAENQKLRIENASVANLKTEIERLSARNKELNRYEAIVKSMTSMLNDNEV